ncbi:MAG TPA: tetratricopeptide repeat protein, partial [Kofleriaceae bacterium]|nr:tetratricopeptide repeat protein [Kofleriaceae bacterium]
AAVAGSGRVSSPNLARPGSERGPRVVEPPPRSGLVGRDAALSVLDDVVQRAIDFSAPQLVTIVGHRGTGKTRLMAELDGRLGGQIRVFSGRAIKEQPFSAISTVLCDRLGVTPGAPDTADRVAEELGAIFAGDATEAMYCLSGFLGLEAPATSFLLMLADRPRQRDELARVVLRRLFELDAARGPSVLLLDDLQDADDASLAILSELASSLGGTPIAIVSATRPEMLVRCPSWGQGAVDHERIDLRNLEPDDAETMFVSLMTRCGKIPDDLIDYAIEVTGGNPQFLDQLVRLFLTNGSIETGGAQWRLDVDRALATELPINVEEAIAARIADLELEERELLEKGAVFGNVFWLSALVAMTRLEHPVAHGGEPLALEWDDGEGLRRRMTDVVTALAEADYLLVLDEADSTMPGDIEIVFKHNLERDLVVKATEAGRAARYHLTAAQWLETRLTDKNDEQLEFLTGLYERGGDRRRAGRFYLLGGDRARARHALDEARTLYERGLEAIGDDQAPVRLEALHNLGDVLDASGETDAALARFGEMLELAWQFDNRAKAGAAHGRIARVLRRQGRFDQAMAHLSRARELFTRAHDDRGIASTVDDMGRVHWLRGSYAQAAEFHRQALGLRRTIGDRRSIALSMANLGRVLFDAGSYVPALIQMREALDLRRDIDDRRGIALSLCDLAALYSAGGNQALAGQLLAEGQAVAAAIGDRQAQAEVASRRAEYLTSTGQPAQALAELAAAKERARGTGDRVGLADAHRRAADAELARGDLVAAEREARSALQLAESVGVRVQLGTALRSQAAVALARGELPGADELFRRAIEILAATGNELELARTYHGFAELRLRRGEASEASTLHQRVTEVIGRVQSAAATE